MKSVINILSISKITQVRFCKSEKLNVLRLKLTNKTDIKVRFVCFQALEGLKLRAKINRDFSKKKIYQVFQYRLFEKKTGCLTETS